METYIKVVTGELRKKASSITDISKGRIYWVFGRGYLVPWEFV